FGPDEVAGRVQLRHVRAATGVAEVEGAGCGVEVGRAVEGAGGEDGARGVHRDAVGDVFARAAETFGPDEVAGVVRLRHDRVGREGAGGGEVGGAGTGVEVGRELEVADGVVGARPVHRDAAGGAVARAAELFGPEEVAGRVQLQHERVEAVAGEVEGAGAGVEGGDAPEGAGEGGGAGGVAGDVPGAIDARPAPR